MKSGTLIRVAVLAPFIVLLLPVSGRAQLSLAAKQVYESAAVVPTNIDGITTYRPRPMGFDAVHAADTELALYGLPQPPNSQADPTAYGEWLKAMTRLGQSATGPLEDMHIVSRNMMSGIGPAGQPVNGSPNWSGFVNFIPGGLASWNSEKSFYEVTSEFNVPVAKQAFAGGGRYVCSGGWAAEVSWNGIDGANNGDVLQGGSYSAAYCNGGSRMTQYCGWVEWYPSYPILCIHTMTVNPGDDMFVTTWDTSPTDGYVFVDDLTQGVYKIVHLKPKIKPYLVGNSAEYIVERPGRANNSLFPLANYVQDYMIGYAYPFHFTTEYAPGLNSLLVTMTNDQGTEYISSVAHLGKEGAFFSDENCALYEGCVPLAIGPP
jgi:Peptidase A4 family